MELSTNRDLDILDNPDIVISRTDNNLFEGLDNTKLLSESFTQHLTAKQYQAHSKLRITFSTKINQRA